MGKEHTEKNNEYVHLAQIMCTLYAIWSYQQINYPICLTSVHSLQTFILLGT
jgi:hypothetical protein